MPAWLKQLHLETIQAGKSRLCFESNKEVGQTEAPPCGQCLHGALPPEFASSLCLHVPDDKCHMRQQPSPDAEATHWLQLDTQTEVTMPLWPAVCLVNQYVGYALVADCILMPS